ncbi:MAG: hypothetical protein ACOYK8_10480 [Alphaproteobacteria bacterium]
MSIYQQTAVEQAKDTARLLANAQHLAQQYGYNGIDINAYLNLSSFSSHREAIRKKRVWALEQPENRGEENQKITDCGIIIEHAYATYQQEFAHYQSSLSAKFQSQSSAAATAPTEDWANIMHHPCNITHPARWRGEFMEEVNNTPATDPQKMNDLIRLWALHDEIVSERLKPWMVCEMLRKIFSATITDNYEEDPCSLALEAVHARVIDLQKKVGYSRHSINECQPYLSPAIQALMNNNNISKIARFEIFEDIAFICEEASLNKIRNFLREPEHKVTRQEISSFRYARRLIL